jgi:NADPH-dependent 2,4-dienoyl-CoA reductase/sulfur reductase-like enzyme
MACLSWKAQITYENYHLFYLPSSADMCFLQTQVRQAELRIDFLIVGGGVAGLAAAIALRRVGHRVVVLEADADVEQVGGMRFIFNSWN